MKRLSSLALAEPECSRRALLQAAAGVGLGALLVSIGCSSSSGGSLPMGASTSCGAGECIDLADPMNAALVTAGGALVIMVATDTVMVVRVNDTDVIALSAICTHQGCELVYDSPARQLTCPCHHSVFSEAGAVIKGPARRAIQAYTAVLADGVITVS